MSFVISSASHPIRICLDAPYKDGVENIRSALWPHDGRISHSFWSMEISDRIIELSKRIFQLGVGVALLLPVVNIIVDLAIRYFRKPDTPHVLNETKFNYISNQAVINKILPQVLQFLDAQGIRGSSIHYRHSEDGGLLDRIYPGNPFRIIPAVFLPRLLFTIRLNNVDKVVIDIPVLVPHSENEVFEAIKRQIIASGLRS